jgi:hypothetical protein
MVRPRLVGFGMGPYAGFFGPDDAAGRLSDDQLDTLRAFNLSYGHAGAWWVGKPAGGPAEPLSEAEQAKEYFTARALAPTLLDAPVAALRYVASDGIAYDLSSALIRDLDLAGPRLRVEYAGGATLWVNHGEAVWPVQLGVELYQLPLHGWLLSGPDGLLAYSALSEGRRVDYLWTPAYTLLDGRGQTTFFGPLSTTDLKVVFADGRVLSEGPGGLVSVSRP